jgi:outer membrane receptor protein involved in Fe transport
MSAQTGKIVGRVIDATTKDAVPLATVMIPGTKIGTSTDTDGKFSLDKIAVGTTMLQASSVGYNPLIKSDIVVTNTKAVTVEFELQPTILSVGEESVVNAAYFMKPAGLPTSFQSLSFEEIRRAPGGFADISRMVQSLPGVVQTGDTRNDLIVRGGSPSENLFLVDGFELPNLNHFGSQGTSGGAVSMLQTEFISEAQFYSGGFSSQYGDKLSSVLDIHLREGNSEKWAGSFDVSMAGAGIIVEGPVSSQTTILTNVRRSYLDLVQKSTRLSAIPVYSNAQVKIIHRLNDHDFLNALFIGGTDNLHIKQDPNGENADDVTEDFELDGNRALVGITWKHIYEKSGYSTLSVWGSENSFKQEMKDFMVLPKIRSLSNHSTEGLVGISYSTTLLLDPKFELNLGIAAKDYLLDYDMVQPADTYLFGILMPAYDIKITKSFPKSEMFAQGVYKPMDELTFTAGVHSSYNDLVSKKIVADPRVGVSYQPISELRVNASYGIFHQSPEPTWILGPNDKNQDLSFLKATHAIAGVEYFFPQGVKLSVEGYTKEYADYPISASIPQLTLANSGDMFVPLENMNLVSEGVGKSRGVDFFIQKKKTDNWYGLISYSYSHTVHKAYDGIERNGTFDIPHVATISGGYAINVNWEISSKFRYVSGRPHNKIDEAQSRQQHLLVYDLTSFNTERYPDFLRWDVRVDYRTYFEHFNIVIYLDVQNVTNRENVWAYNWNPSKNEQITYKQTGFFPVGGLRLEF